MSRHISCRTTCHWRAFVKDGYSLWSIENFSPDRCVIVSPRKAHIEYTGSALPYFQVCSKLRRHIWESMTGSKVPRHAVIRHHCLDYTGRDSRGLCVNPLHLSIGSRDDNRMDSRREFLHREQLGYWKPDGYRLLDPLPESIRTDSTAHQSIDHYHLWSLMPEFHTLPAQEVEAHRYCDLHAKTMGQPMEPIDLELIELAESLLDTMARGEDPLSLLDRIVYRKIPVKKQPKCALHR